MSSRSLIRTTNQLTVDKRHPITPGLEWICADTSSSMCQFLAGSVKTRIEALNEAVQATDPRVQWLGFNQRASVKIDRMPFVEGGGTNFAVALHELIKYAPSYVLFLSDGEDTGDQECVLALAERLATTAIIDTLFIGGSEPSPINLMKLIAEVGHGSFKHWDSTQKQQLSLTSVIQGLLPAPVEITNEVIEL